MSETSLILLDRVQLQSGDSAWAQWVAIYDPLLHRWVRRHALQDCDADDLVQEVLLVVHRELASFRHAGRSGRLSPDGQSVLSFSHDGMARLWNAQTGEALKTLSGHQGRLAGCAFGPEPGQAVTWGYDSRYLF